MSVIREMDKEDVIHTHTHTQSGILPIIEKNEIISFAATWMDL